MIRTRVIRFGDLSGSSISVVEHLRAHPHVESVDDIDVLKLEGAVVRLGRAMARVVHEGSFRRWTASKTGVRSWTTQRAVNTALTQDPMPTLFVGTIPAFVDIGMPYVVYTDRTYREGRANDHGFRSRADPWWAAREARMLRSASAVLTFGPTTVESLVQDYGVAPDRCVAVGAGMNIPELRESIEESEGGGRVRLLFVGRQWELHGGPELIEAIKRIDQHRFVLDVYGCEPVVSLPNVRIHGLVAGDVIAHAMARADIYVRPSRQDAFPIAIVEALRHGLPVVCSKVGNQPWLVGAAGVIVEPGDSAGLARALSTAADELPRLKAAALLQASSLAPMLSWSAVVDAIVERLELAAGS